jgi:L-lactate utilization protein LutB
MIDDQAITQTLAALERSWFRTHYAPSAQEARGWLLDTIPPHAVVGAGDSTTLRQIGIWDELQRRGNRVVNPITKELTLDPGKRSQLLTTLRNSLSSDVYLTSANAVTLDGKLVSIDRVGNRLAGMLFGPPDVIVVMGRNKIVRNQQDAIRRIKNVIAPAHAGWKGRNTPCATTGKCSECDDLDRICRATLIIEKRPHFTSMSVLMVGEDLGLGWDHRWPAERIEAIRTRYQEVTWAFPVPAGVS